MPRRRWSGSWGLWAILLLASSGCATGPSPSLYRVTVPILAERPTEYQMPDGSWYRCYRREDARAIVIELKAACLALGGSPEECQTVEKVDNK